MVKIILTILMLAVLRRGNSNTVHITTEWQGARFFCHFAEARDRFDATVYSTCLWRIYNLFNQDGTFDQSKVSDFLQKKFGKNPDYQEIRSAFQNCVDNVIGTNQGERSFNLWTCVKTAGVLPKMDRDHPDFQNVSAKPIDFYRMG